MLCHFGAAPLDQHCCDAIPRGVLRPFDHALARLSAPCVPRQAEVEVVFGCPHHYYADVAVISVAEKWAFIYPCVTDVKQFHSNF